MARPRGFSLNPEAFDDWLVARNLTRTEYAAIVDLAPSTLSGMTKASKAKGASLPIALRMADALKVKPGTLFPELVGRTADSEQVPA